MDGLANKYLTVSFKINEHGSEVKTIRNVDLLKNKISAKNQNLSNVEVAKLIYKYMGEDENFIERLPKDKLLEAMAYLSV